MSPASRHDASCGGGEMLLLLLVLCHCCCCFNLDGNHGVGAQTLYLSMSCFNIDSNDDDVNADVAILRFIFVQLIHIYMGADIVA